MAEVFDSKVNCQEFFAEFNFAEKNEIGTFYFCFVEVFASIVKVNVLLLIILYKFGEIS